MSTLPLYKSFAATDASGLPSADKAQGVSSDRIVNYTWMNRKTFSPDAVTVRCGVPLHLIDKALENAARYPDVQFNIWMDYSLLDERSIGIVKGHVGKRYQNPITWEWGRKHPNVIVRDLNDIDDFKASSYFAETNGIWARVDSVRLLVVKHCFDTTDAKSIYYSDFDCEDVMLDDEKLITSLENHGMVFGRVKEDIFILAHGYFGFRRDRLDQSCWAGLIRDFPEDFQVDYAQIIKEWGNKTDVEVVPLPPPYTRSYPDQKYVDCGLNHPSQCAR